MQLSQTEVRLLQRKVKIHKANEILGFLLLGAIILGFLGLVQYQIVQAMVLVFSVFLCLGLLSSRPSQELKDILLSVINSDASNIINVGKS